MKDSQLVMPEMTAERKYIKANNERFSTNIGAGVVGSVSISRRIMKDSQPHIDHLRAQLKYIKANNERFSTG